MSNNGLSDNGVILDEKKRKSKRERERDRKRDGQEWKSEREKQREKKNCFGRILCVRRNQRLNTLVKVRVPELVWVLFCCFGSFRFYVPFMYHYFFIFQGEMYGFAQN